jgi:TM2 domain-containing membrane protein YozV
MSDNNVNEKTGFCSKCGSPSQQGSKFCPKCGANSSSPNFEPNTNSIQNNAQLYPADYVKKSWLVTFFLSLFLGGLGVHRFYTGKIVTGLLMLFTVGGFFIWWFIDFILVATGAFTDKKGFRLEKTKYCIPIAWGSFGVITVIIILLVANSSGFSFPSIANSISSSKKLTIAKDEYIALCQQFSYEEIARNPNIYKGKPSFFTGKVIQVTENRKNITLRINVTEGRYSWSDTIYVDYTRLSEDESRILDDDIIKVYGDLNGIKSYRAVLGNTISIPWLIAYYIEK